MKMGPELVKLYEMRAQGDSDPSLKRAIGSPPSQVMGRSIKILYSMIDILKTKDLFVTDI